MDNKDFEVFLRGAKHNEDETLIADIKNYGSDGMTFFVTTTGKYEYIRTHWNNWDVENVISSSNVMPIERFTGHPDLINGVIPFEEPAIISFYDYCEFTPEQLRKSYFLVKNHPDTISVKVLEDNLEPLTKLQFRVGKNYKTKNNGVSEAFIENLSPDAAVPYCNFITEPKGDICKVE
ncbi:hypothetical protein ACKGJO_00870 [Gracilimonas sp. Q87]|uniref:hypothetical protein n=1 Tax=Gracilimonas sp. Q87 TaxID=3384766 RepID=UPI0039840FAF